MPQSAFRNLVDTQYCQTVMIPSLKVKGKMVKSKQIVAKAYLTYEEVLKQIEVNFCSEERDILIAYVSSMKLPTREEQYAKAIAREMKLKEEARILAAKEKAERPTREQIAAANKINPEDYKRGPPRLWNQK